MLPWDLIFQVSKSIKFGQLFWHINHCIFQQSKILPKKALARQSTRGLTQRTRDQLKSGHFGDIYQLFDTHLKNKKKTLT